MSSFTLPTPNTCDGLAISQNLKTLSFTVDFKSHQGIDKISIPEDVFKSLVIELTQKAYWLATPCSFGGRKYQPIANPNIICPITQEAIGYADYICCTHCKNHFDANALMDYFNNNCTSESPLISQKRLCPCCREYWDDNNIIACSNNR